MPDINEAEHRIAGACIEHTHRADMRAWSRACGRHRAWPGQQLHESLKVRLPSFPDTCRPAAPLRARGDGRAPTTPERPPRPLAVALREGPAEGSAGTGRRAKRPRHGIPRCRELCPLRLRLHPGRRVRSRAARHRHHARRCARALVPSSAVLTATVELAANTGAPALAGGCHRPNRLRAMPPRPNTFNLNALAWARPPASAPLPYQACCCGPKASPAGGGGGAASDGGGGGLYAARGCVEQPASLTRRASMRGCAGSAGARGGGPPDARRARRVARARGGSSSSRRRRRPG